MLLPFFWMFSSAFKTTQEINRFPPQWLPSRLSLDNFKRAFEMAPFARYFMNSVIVMVCLGFDHDIHNDSGGFCIFPSALSGPQHHDFHRFCYR